MSTPLLRIDALSVRFPGRREHVEAVTDLSLQLQSNKVLALVGESGSGRHATAIITRCRIPPLSWWG